MTALYDDATRAGKVQQRSLLRMSSALSSPSMRVNYAQGVERYYASSGSTCRHLCCALSLLSLSSVTDRNAHLLGLLKVMHKALDALWTSLSSDEEEVHALDLAAGSGEASEALMTWYAGREEKIPLRIAASDPFTRSAFNSRQAAFKERMASRGLVLDDLGVRISPASTYSFADIAYRDALQSLLPDQRRFDLVIISFALHLIQDKGELWALLRVLSERSRYLLIVAPHKKPEIKEGWGWQRLDPLKPDGEPERRVVGGEAGDGLEIVIESTRLRLYRSMHPCHDGP